MVRIDLHLEALRQFPLSDNTLLSPHLGQIAWIRNVLVGFTDVEVRLS